jgi:hypothetical protein
MAKREYVEANGYPCDPISINEELWLYAEPKGLMVVTNPKGMRGYISWAKVLRAVDDHKKAKSRRLHPTAS